MGKIKTLSLKLEDQKLFILDQTLLPHKELWVEVLSPEQMCDIIVQLKVRGAPLIGVAAGLSLALYAIGGATENEYLKACERLRSTRPTAVNLMWVIDQLIKAATTAYNPEELFNMAVQFCQEDIELCQKIAQAGAELIKDGDQILTHCNTGGLATAGVGTALGVIAEAHRQGKKIHVYVDETRPLLQGARLTTWELEKLNIPYTLICDNMAAHLMSLGKITKAIVGADRIATNGDFANKIGTYTVALSCHYHNIPFYVAAPYTTIDFSCSRGEQIEIELRSPAEVLGVHGAFESVIWSPKTANTYNPAFDVTPAKLVTSWVIDRGVFTSPTF